MIFVNIEKNIYKNPTYPMFQLFKKIFRKKGNHQQTKQMKRRVVYSMKSNENDISDRYQSNQIDDDKKREKMVSLSCIWYEKNIIFIANKLSINKC